MTRKVAAKKYTLELGRRLNLYREQHQWSREKMASVLGVTTNTYGKNENGISFPAIDTLNRLANNLNLSMDWLFFNRGPMYFTDPEKEQEVLQEKYSAEHKKLLKSTAEYMECKKKIPDIDELLKSITEDTRIRHELLLYFHKIKNAPDNNAPQSSTTAST